MTLFRSALALCCVFVIFAMPAAAKKKPAPEKSGDSLEQYVHRLPSAPAIVLASSSGSLFTPAGPLADPYSDVKARLVGDTISIHIVEATTISQSGSLASQRAFTHSSAVTGVGGTSPSFLNPLLAANSNTKLAGTGATASASSLNTVITAQVVAVLPNGSLVLEAHRQILANQQHENVTLRGVVRPADVSSGNLVYSYQLSNLELEVKGKGVISDSVRQPNLVMRTLLKFIGF